MLCPHFAHNRNGSGLESAIAQVKPLHLFSGEIVWLGVFVNQVSLGQLPPTQGLNPNHKLEVRLEVMLLRSAEDSSLQHSGYDDPNIHLVHGNGDLGYFC